MNKLFFGDNLTVLRDHIKDESVDLVYLDPPFNSNANYNVLFGAHGKASEAQAEAFRDSWSWGPSAEDAFDEVLKGTNQNAAIMLRAVRSALGDNDMMAYLAMMTARLIELHRSLKPTGSLYLHCDPTASHYLKVILDAIFSVKGYKTEISWRRQSAHNDAGQGRAQYGNIRDIILFYTKSDNWQWNWLYTKYSEEYIRKFYRHVEPSSGRQYRLGDLTAPGGADPKKRNPHYTFLGVDRYWRFSETRMQNLYESGRVIQTAPGRVPQYKRYLDEMKGVPLQNDWGDIQPLHGSSRERLGYPTQKPLSLLERIIASSSNEGDVVLDPFCGCGTTIEASEKLNRNWLGIDVTHYAVTLIEQRLERIGVGKNAYEVKGRPIDLEGARDLAKRDKHQFQWWAAWRIGSQTYREQKKGADRGIDGNIFYANGPYGTGRIIVSVKGGDHVGVAMVRDLRGVIEREGAEMGVLVTLAEPTGPMVAEAAAAGFVKKSAHDKMPRLQIATVSELLDGRLPKLPPLPQQAKSAPPSRRKRKSDQLEMLLPFPGGDAEPVQGEFIDPRFMKAGLA